MYGQAGFMAAGAAGVGSKAWPRRASGASHDSGDARQVHLRMEEFVFVLQRGTYTLENRKSDI